MNDLFRAALLSAAFLCASGIALADGPGDPKAVKSEDGKYVDKDGDPTFSIGKDGVVDFYTFSGFIRYSANCLQCHGPDAMGSTYAPSLVDAMKHLSYTDFYQTVAGGKQDVNTAQQLVMPAFGTNKNVMCYIDAIYVYLRARADGALGRGRPEHHEPKPAAFTKAEDQCMG